MNEFRDLGLAFIIKVVLTVIAIMTIDHYSLPSHIRYLLFMGVNVLIAVIVISLLKSKYPIKLMSDFEIGVLLKYISIGTGICLLINFPYRIWGGNLESLPREYSFFVTYDFFNKVSFILLLCFIVPVAEEILYRGFFYRILRDRLDIFWSALVSTALFALFHHIADVRTLISIAIPALVYVYVYEKTNSILASIVAHSLNNIGWFLLTFWGIKG